ncbi:MAG: hypothetical protein IJM51_12215 [Clostridia bacterium]|nr:hypothetical protein [Clostridia bacterium]
MSDSKINREYKDRLFRFIFGNPEKKEWTLSLYNAMNGSHYTNPDDLTFNTIEDAVYMSMKNDVSFLIADTFNFYEHQSTFNPNMPMRLLIYAGMIYDSYIETHAYYHRFSSLQQHAPTPKCVCFYNGTTETEDRIILKLSDAFAPGSDPDIEVRVTMININYGHNGELLKACKPLSDYSLFVYSVRDNLKRSRNLEDAIDMAIAEMSEDSIIKPFLMTNRAEVKSMFITEYDEARTFAEQKEEGRELGREEGRAEGRAEGTLKTLAGLVRDGLLTISQAAERVNMTVPEFELKMQSV